MSGVSSSRRGESSQALAPAPGLSDVLFTPRRRNTGHRRCAVCALVRRARRRGDGIPDIAAESARNDGALAALLLIRVAFAIRRKGGKSVRAVSR
jgi:hypothetical protein